MQKEEKQRLAYDAPVDFIENTPISLKVSSISHIDMHYHMDIIEIVYCLKGSVNIICNHESLKLKSGEIFTINHQDVHCMFSDEDNTTIILHLDMRKLEVPFEDIDGVYFAAQDEAIQKYQEEALNDVKAHVLALAYTITDESKLDCQKIQRAANRIVKTMIEYFDWFSYMHFNENQIEILRDRFKEIIKYCHTHYQNKITITDIAELVHLNNNYTSQFLGKSSYGSFNGMMAYIRCYEAQYLLLNTTLPLDEISILCGFSDTKYFYKNFNIWWCKKPKKLRDWFETYSETKELFYTLNKADAHKFLEPYLAAFLTARTLD